MRWLPIESSVGTWTRKSYSLSLRLDASAGARRQLDITILNHRDFADVAQTSDALLAYTPFERNGIESGEDVCDQMGRRGSSESTNVRIDIGRICLELYLHVPLVDDGTR